MQARRIPRASTLTIPITIVAATLALGERAIARGDLPARKVPGGARSRSIERVHYDVGAGGEQLARGATYKVRFDTEGATYVPFLGSKAPRNYPVTFRLERVSVGGRPISFDADAPATRCGDTVRFERGDLVELYDLSLDSIEQKLVFGSLPAGGDLVVRYAALGELATSASQAPGGEIELANDLGAVRYGKATVLDARGATASASTAAVDGGIEIRVPGSFLAAAAFPVTIDPVVTTFAVDTTADFDFDPDVAYDATTDRYLVCYEEAFSDSDHDVYERLFDSGGNLITGGYVDSTTVDWRHPRTANNDAANQFLVVAHAGASGSRSIVGRTVDAATNAMGGQAVLASSAFGFERLNPDVGGDPEPSGSTNYLVVSEEYHTSNSESWIVQTLVGTNGLPNSGNICIQCGAGTRNFSPAVSNSAGSVPGLLHRWSVVWEYEYSPSDHDIYGAQQVNALLVAGPYAIDTSFDYESSPTVSSFSDASAAPGNYLVAYERSNGVDYDIQGMVMNGSAPVASANLSAAEGPDFAGQHQVLASADSDGLGFVVAYTELFGTSATDWDVYVGTFAVVGTGIDAIEPHQNLAYTTDADYDPQICAARGASSPRPIAAWSQFPGSGADIYAGFYDRPSTVSYCFPGSNGVMGCPCGNPPANGGGCDNSNATGGAVLATSGTPSLAADTLGFTQSYERPTAFSIFLQGNADIVAGTVFGEGIRCAGGTLKRLFLHNASGGIVNAPVGSDLQVSARSAALGDPISAGSARFYQVYYRDPNLAACPTTFNVGNGVKVLWGP